VIARDAGGSEWTARDASKRVPGGNTSVKRSARTPSNSSSPISLTLWPTGVSSISLRPRRISERSGAESCAVSVRVKGELGWVDV
jgi:hypothetical protein